MGAPRGQPEVDRVSRCDLLGNDRWEARFVPDCLGPWQFRVSGWLDRWETWRHGTKAKVDAGQDVSVEVQTGLELLAEVVAGATRTDVVADRVGADRVRSRRARRPAREPGDSTS